jgi:hypothetical protein
MKDVIPAKSDEEKHNMTLLQTSLKTFEEIKPNVNTEIKEQNTSSIPNNDPFQKKQFMHLRKKKKIGTKKH